ncbi:unnamed protein product [Clavelina lepadiformis]|uniref:DUF4708 domain-containing protein n=2 Tax=Clavelina lepadiformis TaxID=159417 RepID=A0ABP0F5B2_CLALP
MILSGYIFYTESTLWNLLFLQVTNASLTRNVGLTLERCVRYTSCFRLSSDWHQVKNLLVNHKDFLNCNGKMDAVDFDLTIAQNELVLKIKPHCIRLPPPKLDSFGICPEAIEKFNQDPNYEIPWCAINNAWCHVLPTMSRGELVGISRKVPAGDINGNVLKDYAGLRRYWKSQYGYTVPEQGDKGLFCSVYFKLIGGDCFTYPLICLRTHPVQHMPRCDTENISKKFIAAVRCKLPRLCGIPLTYSTKACSAVTKLCSLAELKPGLPQNVQLCAEMLPSSSSQRIVPNVTKFHDRQKNANVIPTSQKVDNQSDTQRVPTQANSSNGRAKALLSQFPMTSEGKYKPIFVTKKPTSTKFIPPTNKFIPMQKSKAKEVNSSCKTYPDQVVPKTPKEKISTKSIYPASSKAPPKNVVASAIRGTDCVKRSRVSTQQQTTLCTSNAKPMKHKFDQLFASASSSMAVPEAKSRKKCKFDTVFSSALKSKNNVNAISVAAQQSSTCKKKSMFNQFFTSASKQSL